MLSYVHLRYGLILPQKSASKSALLSRPSVFGDDSDDEVTASMNLNITFSTLKAVHCYKTISYIVDLCRGDLAEGGSQKEDDEAGDHGRYPKNHCIILRLMVL